jgi:hypothetical protein
MQRSDARYIVEEIKKAPDYLNKLNSWESNFLRELDRTTSHYGFSVSDKQGEVLKKIYRKVWDDPWLS